jgi:hypothetical protein
MWVGELSHAETRCNSSPLRAGTLPADFIFSAQENLASELNEHGPFADVVTGSARPGTKSLVEEFGQVGLALLSAGALKYITQVIIEFVRRNKHLTITVGDITISKDHASKRDEELLNKRLMEIMAQKSKVEKRR